MKSLINSIVCMSLLVFVIACGKEKSKGGGDTAAAPPIYMNPVIDPNMSQSGQAALANLKAWYAAAETTTLGFRGTYTLKTSNQGNFSFQGSLCFFGKGINCNPPAPTHCFIKNASGNYDLGTATGTALADCSITQSNVVKANNAELTAAVNGNGSQLLDVQQSGNVYYLVYGVNAYQPQAVYTIDTSHHSILNPVRIQTINGNSVSDTYKTGLQTFQF